MSASLLDHLITQVRETCLCGNCFHVKKLMLVILALFLAGHVIIRFILVSTTDVVTIVSENSMCLAIVCDICMINMAQCTVRIGNFDSQIK